MRVVEINSVVSGSTGRIMLNIAEMVKKNGDEAYTFSENKNNTTNLDNHLFFGSFAENIFHRCFSLFSGISGKGSVLGTKQLLCSLDELTPDILHLHNLHGWYINLPMLFSYIREKKIRTVWTLHDCWAFTAQCSHFTMEKCEKWKTGCYTCPRYRLYPYTFVDKTPQMWKLKKEWFTGVENLTVVTPSQWLAGLVRESFLKDYPVRVINNGIDLDTFKPITGSFRTKYGIPASKYVLLGVAAGWNGRKGLDVFVELANRLDLERFQIVLVGTDEKIEKQLPECILSISRTESKTELAEIYSAADLLVNPTREENFPTVNIEALACGTPVVTFCTGGSPEIPDAQTGAAVPYDDIDALEREILQICANHPFAQEDCLRRAKCFDAEACFNEYCSLFHEILTKG